MPIDLRPQSSTAMSPLREMIVASTVSATSKPGHEVAVEGVGEDVRAGVDLGDRAGSRR